MIFVREVGYRPPCEKSTISVWIYGEPGVTVGNGVTIAANSVVTINEYSKKLIECNKLFGTEKLSDTSKKFFVQSAAYILEANKSKNNIVPEAKLLAKELVDRITNKNQPIHIFDYDIVDLSIIEVSQNIPDLITTITDLNTLIISGAKANDIDIENIKIIESLKNEL